MLLIFMLLLGQLSGTSKSPEARIKIQVTQSESYYVLTKDNSLKFEVSGPTWVRVFTRIPWKKEFRGPRTYKMILVSDDANERFISKETENSKIAKIDGVSVSKWRSFYIRVPEGTHKYELLLWRAPVDTVFCKFSFEAPGKWIDLSPAEVASVLEIVEDEKIVKYYEVRPEKPLVVEIEGPLRIKVQSRANFKKLDESGVYSVSVKSNGRLTKEVTYSAKPSETVYYRNRKELIPSVPDVFYLNFKKGKHRVEIRIMGVESAAIRVQVPAK